MVIKKNKEESSSAEKKENSRHPRTRRRNMPDVIGRIRQAHHQHQRPAAGAGVTQRSGAHRRAVRSLCGGLS